jgi:outer membrane protein insertion porin family
VGQLFTHWRRIRGSRQDFLSSLGVSQLQRDGFTEETRFLSLQVSRRLSRRSTLMVRYRLEDVSLTDIDISRDEITEDDVFLASLGTAVVRNTLDDPFLPRRGGIGAVDLSVFASAVGSEENFTRLFMGRNHFWPFLGGNIVFSTSARVGLSREFGGTEEIPISERFFAGGIENVRGFKQDFLGPLDDDSGDPVGGAALIVLNQEARFRLMDRLNLHLFLDAGNVYPEIGDVDLDGLRFTAGPGFSYVTPAGPIRIYYGFKLDRKDGEDSGRFHFTFGRAF